MSLPEGRLLRSRVVEDAGTALGAALERELSGYAVLEPQDALLLDADDTGALVFRAGVAVAAHHTGTGRGGPAALADLAVPGPYSVELYAVDDPGRQDPDRRIPTGMAAERLAGDAELVARVRGAAQERGVGDPARRGRTGTGTGTTGEQAASDDGTEGEAGGADAVRAFLDDEEKLAAIKEQAREQARDRAAEWGIEDQLADEG